MRRGLLLASALLVLGAMLMASSTPAAASTSAARERTADAELFSGFLVPASATDVHAPESGFRVAGWSSWGYPAKLLELAPDGAVVKTGDVVARFEFRGSDAKNWLGDRLRGAEAEASRTQLAAQQSLEALETELSRKRLDAKTAELQLQRERIVSARQAELDRLAKRVADFEVESVEQRLAAKRRAVRAERAYHDEAVRQAKEAIERLAFYEKRTALRAPHDGVVRHAFNANERRKVQKGDALQSGMKVLSVAKDSALAVRFFVPEQRLGEVKPGAEVAVVTVGAGLELAAQVSALDHFPQELGMLLENNALPNAREKAFAVRALLAAVPERVTSGTEVRARMKP